MDREEPERTEKVEVHRGLEKIDENDEKVEVHHDFKIIDEKPDEKTEKVKKNETEKTEEIKKLEIQKVENQKDENRKIENRKIEIQKVEDEKIENQKVEDEKIENQKIKIQKVENRKIKIQKVDDQKIEIQKVEIQKVEDQKVEDKKTENQRLEIEGMQKALLETKQALCDEVEARAKEKKVVETRVRRLLEKKESDHREIKCQLEEKLGSERKRVREVELRLEELENRFEDKTTLVEHLRSTLETVTSQNENLKAELGELGRSRENLKMRLTEIEDERRRQSDQEKRRALESENVFARVQELETELQRSSEEWRRKYDDLKMASQLALKLEDSESSQEEEIVDPEPDNFDNLEEEVKKNLELRDLLNYFRNENEVLKVEIQTKEEKMTREAGERENRKEDEIRFLKRQLEEIERSLLETKKTKKKQTRDVETQQDWCESECESEKIEEKPVEEVVETKEEIKYGEFMSFSEDEIASLRVCGMWSEFVNLRRRISMLSSRLQDRDDELQRGKERLHELESELRQLKLTNEASRDSTEMTYIRSVIKRHILNCTIDQNTETFLSHLIKFFKFDDDETRELATQAREESKAFLLRTLTK